MAFNTDIHPPWGLRFQKDPIRFKLENACKIMFSVTLGFTILPKEVGNIEKYGSVRSHDVRNNSIELFSTSVVTLRLTWWTEVHV